METVTIVLIITLGIIKLVQIVLDYMTNQNRMIHEEIQDTRVKRNQSKYTKDDKFKTFIKE